MKDYVLVDFFKMIMFCFFSMIVMLYLLPLIQAIEWGTSFGGLYSSYINDTVCNINEGYTVDKGRKHSKRSKEEVEHWQFLSHCRMTKTYMPSPYEQRQRVKNKELIDLYPNYEERRKALMDLMTSDLEIDAANIWLERVRVHVTEGAPGIVTAEDEEYLSRFRTLVTCPDHLNLTKASYSWDNWIEPLNIYFRHPFSYEGLDNFNHILQHPITFKNMYHGRNARGFIDLINNDYVLVEGLNQNNGTPVPGCQSLPSDLHIDIPLDSSEFTNTSSKHKGVTKNYMLDAGSSRYDSSLFWFVCSYLLQGLTFDRIFAWEFTLLEPRDYWQHVPEAIKLILTFFNIPITNDNKDMDCPLQFIKKLASPRDFVSFKLDVDNQDVEIPIAMKLSQDPELYNLVDEFFFELHFNHELMTASPIWGTEALQKSLHGLNMDRVGAWELFHTLREKGVRAHVWP